MTDITECPDCGETVRVEHEESSGLAGEGVVVREWKEVVCPACGPILGGADPDEVEAALEERDLGV